MELITFRWDAPCILPLRNVVEANVAAMLMRIWPYNDLRRPADGEISVLHFPDKFGTNSPSPWGLVAWLA